MLEQLKIMLDIDADETGQDERLELIIANVTKRLQALLGGVNEVPESLDYIILEVSVIRFNKIGSEGLSGHSVEGENMTFNDDDFAAFADDIQTYLESQKESTKGRMRFI